MADIIEILPDHVANQIAAGEVIQRPASVVKELLENSVDAQSTHIQLIVRDAGRTLIQVKDDGMGMTAGDARRCFERHATSKIKDAADVFSIRTKGFRGEALASIAAVAQVELITARQGDEAGTCIKIEGSQFREEEAIATTPGTSILVKNLFFNIPARRNFLKSNPVETRHIMDEFHRVAIAHPDTAFSFFHNDSEVYQLEKSSLRQRLVSIYGKNFNQRLVPVEEETDLVKISGFIGKPAFSRKTRGEQFFFVNGRFIKSSYLHHAVQFAFRELIQEDAHATYFLFLETDPASIDINIHPTKTEVKFEDEKALYAILQSTIRKSLGQYNIAPSLDFNQESAFSHIPPAGNATAIRQPQTHMTPGYNPFASPSSKDAARFSELLYGNMPSSSPETIQPGMSFPAEHGDTGKPTETGADHTEEKLAAQLHNTFILKQIKSGLLVIDQNLAHQRILYERYLHYLNESGGPSQQLLFPEQIDLSADDYAVLEEILDDLKNLGFDVRPFGNTSVVIHGLPAEMPDLPPAQQLEHLLEQVRTNRTDFKMNHLEALARSLSRNAAVRTGKQLRKEEISDLIDELFSCSQPNISPDGKPVMMTLSLDFLKQNLKGK